MATDQPLCVDYEQREIFLEMSSLVPAVCFQCGTCTAICPVFSVNEKYNPRKIIRMLLLGMNDEVLKSDFIWFCSGCYSCTELCPRGVKVTDLMGAIRNIAVREGHIPPALKASVDLLKKHGRLLEISEFENTVRSKKDMPELKLRIEDIEKLLDKTGIYQVMAGKGSSDE